MGCYLTSVVDSGRSTTISVLTIASVAAMYNSSMSSGFGGTSVGRDFRYCLSLMIAAAA
jgi:hypothetical protein